MKALGVLLKLSKNRKFEIGNGNKAFSEGLKVFRFSISNFQICPEQLPSLRQMAKAWLLPVFSLLWITGYGQSFKAYERAAKKAFAKKDYYTAIHYWRSALERKPEDIASLYQYAEAARLFYAFETAAETYEKVLKNKKAGTFPEAGYYLGLVRKGMGQYDAAQEAFVVYLDQKTNLAFEQQANLEHKACQKAKERMEQPGPYSFSSLSRRINTPYSDFGAWEQGDSMYYSSYRFENKQDRHQPKRKISKILYTSGSGRGRAVRNLNSDTIHTAHTTISLDAKRLYYTLCRYEEEGNINCAIYYRKRARRNRWGTRAYRLPSAINLEGSTNTQPAIGYDSSLQAEVLYFVSNRKEGKGGMDIWWSKVEPGENKFSDPHSFYGNTESDEITPFIHNEQQRLYFSADYVEGLGGFDIYYRSLQDQANLQPGILPPPLNSSYNDIYFSLQASGKSGLLSSNRPGENYLDALSKSCCNDIYRFVEIPSPDTTPIAGQNQPDTIPMVPPVTPEPPVFVPPPPPDQLAEFLPLALYFDNDEPDPRTRRAKTRKDYLTTFSPYAELEDTYIEEYSALFPIGQETEAAEKMTQFFEREVKFGAERLQQFSQLLLQRLQEGKLVEIFVKGFTSPRAKSDYNLLLGKRRVSSLVNHFEVYQNGVFKPYLKKGQLVISEKSFGETTASKSVSDDLEDIRRSVYSIDAARERRVEIVEVKRN